MAPSGSCYAQFVLSSGVVVGGTVEVQMAAPKDGFVQRAALSQTESSQRLHLRDLCACVVSMAGETGAGGTGRDLPLRAP